MKRPLVSVIVPTYNRPETLGRALESILAQTMPDFEALVVNDHGQDVGALVESFGDDRIRHMVHLKNRGLAATRNTALRAARGKYVCYLDDDDAMLPRHLAVLSGYLETHPERVAYTRSNWVIEKVLEDGRRERVSTEPYPAFDFSRDDLLWHNLMPVCAIMHEKALLAQTGLFNEKLDSHEDYDLWVRMSRKYDFAVIEEITNEVFSPQAAATMSKNRLRMFRTLITVYGKYASLSAGKEVVQARQLACLRQLEREAHAFLLLEFMDTLIELYAKNGFEAEAERLRAQRRLLFEGQAGPSVNLQ